MYVLIKQTKLSIAKKIKTLAMIRSYAMYLNSLTMLLCGVAFIAQPVVMWVFPSQFSHIIVAIGLGKNASCCYLQIFTIALNYCAPGCCKVGMEAIAIDDDILGCGAQRLNSHVHTLD